MKPAELNLETLRLEQEGRVLTAYYSSPPLNFVTTAFLGDLDQLTRAVDRDSSVGAVVLASDVEGRFLTHADAGELGAMADLPLPELPAGAVLPFWKLVNRAIGLPGGAPAAQRGGPMGIGLLWGHRWKKTILRMNRSGVVYLAAISGPALGGGHEIALACDLRYAADDPRVVLGQIETLAGIIPGGGGTQRLPRLIGTGRALELILEGAPVDVHRAYELGLVHRVVATDELLEETQATAARLANRSPSAVAAAKRCVYGATDRPLRSGLDRELAAFLSTGSSAYSKRAFKEFATDFQALADTPFVADPAPWVDGTRITQGDD
ncbi:MULTISPECIES: enoyl-CoA hydratase/isomerase family protein [Nocardioides]|uniref:Enoyl-CoA hydratase/isomerase family protein n=1 Tax=Nocardioides vastitatis TaxID=2568655 RepID=A0ABW0ZHE4_9ACTN|nr:enoyl-CoA hydratase/isomerase family protein [Nocardioides sp.]THJ08620.1 enoyl-CoA hydratase/isomerase family protein [Nocardioides sp.]